MFRLLTAPDMAEAFTQGWEMQARQQEKGVMADLRPWGRNVTPVASALVTRQRVLRACPPGPAQPPDLGFPPRAARMLISFWRSCECPSDIPGSHSAFILTLSFHLPFPLGDPPGLPPATWAPDRLDTVTFT